MGDMADFSMSMFLDRGGNPDKRDTAFYSNSRRINSTANKTCKRCGKTMLYWDLVSGKYRLHEKNGAVHSC